MFTVSFLISTLKELIKVLAFNKGIILRSLLCLISSLLLLQFEESKSYDFRYRLRGPDYNTSMTNNKSSDENEIFNENKSEIQRASFSLIFSYLVLLLVISILIIFAYPISVSFLLYLGLGLFTFLISIYFFDIHNFWIPIRTPVFQLFFTFTLLMSFKLSLKENATWKLNHELSKQQEYDDLKNNFIGLISHDLKTPIAKIQSIIDRLLLQKSNDIFKNDLQKLRNENSELHKYIQTILKLLQVESQQIKINKQNSDINQIITEVENQLQPIAHEKGIQIQLNLEPMFLIDFDPLLIREVLLNLLENAIKYSKANSTILVSSSDLNSEVLIIVEDSGIGIPKGEQQKVFQKFYRATKTQNSTSGTGLGLYLVNYFISLHGGRVFVESQEGSGSTFGFTIPIDSQGALTL